MKVSYSWLQDYFDKPVSKPEEIARLFTMHAFELEGMETIGGDTVFDFKILPNRAHDCLSHGGIARELSVLSGIPLKTKVESVKFKAGETKHTLKISVEDRKLCRRYAGRIIENVKIGESPKWLKERLESIGQRSINNVVDITNYVMFATGQPLHAFDLEKLSKSGNEIEIIVRTARAGEKLVTLDGKDIILDETMLVIADKEKPVALAGIKGGKWAEVDGNTKHVVLESANFEPTSTRKTSQKVGVRTDSEKRFENEITPELAGRGMEMATALFAELASAEETKIGEAVDVYTARYWQYKVGVSCAEVNKLLGTNLSENEVNKILKQLGFEYEHRSAEEAIRAYVPECLGKPYKSPSSMREDAPNEFSCSSLISYLYTMAGIWMPSLSVDKYAFGSPVDEKNLRFGDLVFANTENGKIYYETVEYMPGIKIPSGVDHVGMFMGDGNILHSSRVNGKVVVEPLKDAVQFKNIIGYRRIFPDLSAKRVIVSVPAERLDMRIKEDLIEEIGRVHGYEDIPSVPPGKPEKKPEINKTLHYANIVRETLADLGFSEVQTYALVSIGEVELANPMAEDKSFLRANLSDGLAEGLELNVKNAPLIGVPQIKIFEIGKVFSKNGEHTSCALAVSEQKKNPAETALASARAALEKALNTRLEVEPPNKGVVELDFDALVAKLPEPAKYEIPETPSVIFKPISAYPFVLRDIAVFVPENVTDGEVLGVIKKEGGELLVKERLFDVFKKDGKTSYAFNLVFQSYKKTLSDEEVNGIMEKITGELNGKDGWKVR